MSIQPNSRQLISCEECGLVVRIPEIEQGQKAQCPRCSHSLTKINAKPYQSVIAVSSACLIMLVLSISFPFMSFSVQGLSQEITLLHAAKMLAEFQNALLGALLLATVVVLPAIYVGLILFLHLEALKARNHPPSKKQQRMAKVLCRILFRVEPWLMVDVFLIGVLVSLIKIASLADIGMGSSFWAFCVYTILVVKCISMVDKSWLWGTLFRQSSYQASKKVTLTTTTITSVATLATNSIPSRIKNISAVFAVTVDFTNTTRARTYKKRGHCCLPR